MKIKTIGPDLSVVEVYAVVKQERKSLEERYAAHKRDPAKVRDETVSLERCLDNARSVTQYLERCYPVVQRADEDGIREFLAKVADFPLSRAEVLQIIDLTPTDPVFFDGLCQDLSDEQADQLAALVRQHLLKSASKPVPIEDGSNDTSQKQTGDSGDAVLAVLAPAEGEQPQPQSQDVPQIEVQEAQRPVQPQSQDVPQTEVQEAQRPVVLLAESARPAPSEGQDGSSRVPKLSKRKSGGVQGPAAELTVAQLRQKLKGIGLLTDGNRSDLVERYESALVSSMGGASSSEVGPAAATGSEIVASSTSSAHEPPAAAATAASTPAAGQSGRKKKRRIADGDD
eukprot:CAMPEP_0203843168 /NCGR_PEP_ID=MMETSP0359-20131031/2438_1 /ASSEMBLY_ACC=CAM_ASM_000338 /TAXON_ID=268821 /ORGANISM="Scrippsiella Hangoei, Strain SHTV-5" /LENGTH=341 /DNA_ID=CAMNT_0050757903 /DNA_START=24 /DNA_END=1049 /DNA_ORIENTATION=+